MIETKLKMLAVDLVEPSDDNPRLDFPQEQLDKLSQSIDKEGILVPIVVHKNGERFKLIDGERRFRCALDLGLEEVPVIVVDPMDDTEKLVQMFNIHMVREPWKDMPTAWALGKLLAAQPGITDRELVEVTGLSPERIERFRHALQLPDEYQKYIREEVIPLNFFWELKTNVVDPLARLRPQLLEDLGEDHIVEQFVAKNLDKVVTNVVSLRKIRPIISAAAQEEDAGHDPAYYDDTIRTLVNERSATIEEAYENTVEIIIEADKLERRSAALVRAFERALEKARSEDERTEVVRVLMQHVEELRDIVNAQDA